MANAAKREVLKAFKSLHKARLSVFKDDNKALEAARKKINEEFVKYKNVTDKGAIQELLKLSSEVEQELKTRIVQAREVEPGKFGKKSLTVRSPQKATLTYPVYKVRITPETEKLVNVPYEDMPEEILAKGKNVPCTKK